MISIINVLIGLIFATVFFMFRTDILWFIRSLKYFRQGITSRYYPIKGFMKYAEEVPGEDSLVNWAKIFWKNGDPNKTEKFILANGYGPTPVLILNDTHLNREYYKMKEKVSYAANNANLPFEDCFLFKDPTKAMKQRSVFNPLFLVNNMRKATPEIIKIINRHFASMKRRIPQKPSQDGFTELSLQNDMQAISRDIVSYFLFGEEAPKVFGESISDQIEKLVGGFYVHFTSDFWHQASGGLSTKLGLSSNYNKLRKIQLAVHEEIKKLVNHRRNSKDYVRGMNVIDVMLDHNDQMDAEGRPEEKFSSIEIMDNISIMVFGGIETTKNFMLNCIDHLSKNPEFQTKLRDAVRKDVFSKKEPSYNYYTQSEFLEIYLFEALRVFSSGWMTIYRIISKDFTLGGIKISKGTGFLVSYYSMMKRPEFFEDPTAFDLRKYEDKERIQELKKHMLIPFGTGARNCIGRNLARLTAKAVISNLVDQFELRPTKKINYKVAKFTYAVVHCDTLVKPLK